jgi:hypothetical protein
MPTFNRWANMSGKKTYEDVIFTIDAFRFLNEKIKLFCFQKRV